MEVFEAVSSMNPLGSASASEESAVAAGAGVSAAAALGARAVARLAEDSNAVVCPDWFVRTRLLLHTDAGEPAFFLRLLPWLALFRVVSISFYVGWRVTSVSDPSVNDMMLMVAVGTFHIMGAAFTMIVFELCAVLREPEGELQALGAGKTKIRSSELASLQFQRRMFQGVQAFGVVMAVGACVPALPARLSSARVACASPAAQLATILRGRMHVLGWGLPSAQWSASCSVTVSNPPASTPRSMRGASGGLSAFRWALSSSSRSRCLRTSCCRCKWQLRLRRTLCSRWCMRY
jgi:hypothetical protein